MKWNGMNELNEWMNELTWLELNWNEMKRNETKRNEMKWNEMKEWTNE